ncbi:hypothetical protein [Nitrospira sp. Nam74]
MHKTIEYTALVKEAFNLEASGLKADADRNRAGMMAGEMGGPTREISGEARPVQSEGCLL